MRTYLHTLVAALLVACKPAVRTPSPPASPSPAATPDVAPVAPPPADPSLPRSHVALFDALADKIEAHHVFAEGPKARWPANRARLREEFARVATRTDALAALFHVQAALGDRHCYLSPPTDLRRQWLSLGVELHLELVADRPVVRVDEIRARDLAALLAEGDEVVAVDGTPVAAWLAAHPFESNSLNPDVNRAETARAITTAMLPWSTVQAGDRRTLRVLHGGRERDVTLEFVHPEQWEESDGLDFDDAPPMAAVTCRHDRRPLYEDFALATVGVNLCIYRPTRGKPDTRLVRYMSFHYAGHDASDALRAAKADHDLLVRELAGARAVILDVHENRGGQNPFVFLSWFARRPWDHQQIHIRVSPAFSVDDAREFLFGDTALVARYRDAAAQGKSEESWPFLCAKDGAPVLTGTCEAQGPRTAELVTDAPVAIVTGPDCTSSCDSLVSDWSTFGMGPLVGRQPAHGFTTVRHGYPLIGPDGRDLGTFRIALSWETYPRSGKPLEGAPLQLDWEAPASFATRHSWIDLAVKEARRRVEARPPTSPRTPAARPLVRADAG